jgi:hypothetical protein
MESRLSTTAGPRRMIAGSPIGVRRVSLLRARLCAVLVFLACSATPVAGQQPPAHAADSGTAARYEPMYDEFKKLAPSADRVATVHDLTLRRDVIVLRLADGKLYLGTPVAGRTVAAVFVGQGSIAFAPPIAVERRELRRVLHDSVLDARISAAALVFTDSTLAELEHRLSFAPGTSEGAASGVLHDAVTHLVDDRAHELLQPTLSDALLNGWATGFFYAHVKREHGEDLMVLVDPAQGEQVELLRGGKLEGQKVQIVSQFRAATPDTAGTPLALQADRIEATIASGLQFSATATVTLTARRDAVRWARFLLFSELAVDSVRDTSGAAVTFFRTKPSEELWVRFGAPLRRGEARALRVTYHGDLIGHWRIYEHLTQGRANLYAPPPGLDTWLYVKQPETWFPRYAPANPRYGNLPGADVDMTFHSPTKYRFASAGRQVESRVAGDVTTTRWVTERPTTEVCFNLGRFDEYKIADPRLPPVTVQVNLDGHAELNKLLPTRGAPERDVGADVAASLAFFTRQFGPPLFSQYYATEIPFFYGQAFPGLIYLSFETFQTGDETGEEETFRSHEIAHQWWGIGVTPASYRDVWLSEGFAEFSGLWYTQVILKDNDKFLKQLRERRKALRARHDAPPLGLGWRVHQTDEPRDYWLTVYQKGAWVVHMLRNLMIDFPTMREDAFAALMGDFYQQYRGRAASTEDFQHVVESHFGRPMDWFFDEWVNGTAIPTYVFSWHAEPGDSGHYRLHLRVRQEDAPADFVMPVPVQIDLAGGGQAFVRVAVTGPVTERTFPLPAEPTRVELNPLESVLAEVNTEDWH